MSFVWHTINHHHWDDVIRKPYNFCVECVFLSFALNSPFVSRQNDELTSLGLLAYNYLVRCRQLTRNATCWSVAMVHLIKLKICFGLRSQQHHDHFETLKRIERKNNKQPQTFFFRLRNNTMAHPPFTYSIMKPQQHMCVQMSTHITTLHVRCFHSVQPKYEEHWTTNSNTKKI